MAKAAKIIAILLAAMVLLVVIAAVLVQTQWAREKIEDELSQRLDGRAVEIGSLEFDWGFPLGVSVGDVEVANPAWAEHPYMLKLDAMQAKLEVGALLTGDLRLQSLELDQPEIHLDRQADGRSNWAALTPDESSSDSTSPIQPDIIRIQNGRLTYRDAGLDAEVTLDIATTDNGAGQRQLSIEGSGNVQGKPLTLSLRGEPPAQALASDAPYAVTLTGQLGEIQARFSGEAKQLPQLDSLNGRLTVSAPDSAELMAFDHPAIDIPAFDFSTRLKRDGPRWALEDNDLKTGESHLTGALTLDKGDTPELTVRMQGDRLDLNRWGVMRLLSVDSNDTPADATGDQQSLQQRAQKLLQPLRRYRGEVDLSLDKLLYGDSVLSDIVLKGSLAEQRLDIERLHAAQGDGTISASGSFDLTESSLSGTLDLTIEELDLGRALEPMGYPKLGTLDGEVHAKLGQNSARLSDTHLRYENPARDLWIDVDATATESGLQLMGNARRNGVPLHFELEVGALDELLNDRPYPIEGTIRSRESELTVDGTITYPLQFSAADLAVSLKGPNPANLNALTGLSLPSLTSYQLRGQLLWEDQQLRLLGLRAQWGESDLSGDIRLSLAGRPMLWVNLHSNTLHTSDLKAPDTPTDPNDGRVFSDESLGLDALRDRDAIVRYEADNMMTKAIPLNAVKFKVELDEGVLVADPLTLAIGKGKANGRLRLDVRPQQPTGELQLDITSVTLSPVLREANLPQVAQDSAKTMGGQLDLTFEGQSLGAMAADLDGKLELAMSGGKLDMLAVELLGLDAGEAAVAALADSDQVDMNCAYLRFVSNQGTASLAQLYINTSDSNITGGGEIDLGSEQLDLAFETRAKDFSLLSGNSPIQLKGTLSDPQVSVVSDQLIARVLASVAGALIAPPLAILPWVEAGLGEGSGVGCRKALAEFEQGSAS
ncbi:AsmA family protein [Stutzerimonas zhaodongensis]|uniref:AsmA family protein n=1 Tax=Stutzerimonas zhaodongensis TaxID=1176257 RepID=UPI002107B7E3|nr:AsmA family protein [Stutzerimonas zhaodongensis]